MEALVEETKEAGNHSVRWNAAAKSSGVYLARFTATPATVALQRTRKLVLAK